MEHRQLKRTDLYIGAFGMILSSASLFWGDGQIFLSTFIGFSIAFINWIGFRVLLEKLLDNKSRKGRVGMYMGLKSLAMLGIVSLVLTVLPIHMIAFVVGISSLPIGISANSFVYGLRGNEILMEEEL
jgi:F0F1-type ATP synthase assembly protein I